MIRWLLVLVICILAGFIPASTITHSPAVSQALANGECLKFFDDFAYDGPGPRNFDQKLPHSSWQQIITLPHQLRGYSHPLYGPHVAISRMIDLREEIWITHRPYYGSGATLIAILDVFSQKWELIPSDIGYRGLVAERLFVTSDGKVWASSTRNVPVLSQFNENTRRFELVEIVVKVPSRLDEFASRPEMLLDQSDNFWIFMNNDGIYHYDTVIGTTEKRAEMLGTDVVSATIAPDGVIYFADISHSPLTYTLEQISLFQFSPETSEITPINRPDSYETRPIVFELMVDRAGRLWLGSVGYREPDGSWHLVHSNTALYFDRLGQYLYAPPWPILESSDGRIWFQKFLDTGGWGEGTAWYDPATDEGCLFTNQPANIIEDAQQQLWMVAGGNLYKYPLNP